MNWTIISTLPSTFVAIVECGSLSRAAEELGLARSAVSQNLRRLEDELGIQLAVRTTRRFSLTPAGERYYRRCKEIRTLAARAATEMEEFGATPSGRIKMTAPHAMVAPIIAPAMAELVQQFPKLQPTVVADDRRLDIVSERVDVAITIGQLDDSRLKAQRIGSMEDVLCVSKMNLAGYTRRSTKQELRKIQALPYIAHQRERTKTAASFSLQGTHGARDIRAQFQPTLIANTVEALLAFCRQGLGVALLPNFAVADDLRCGELVRVFPKHTLGENPIYAVHAYTSYVPKSVQACVEAVKESLAR